MLDPPDATALKQINDVTIEQFPRMALARQERDHPQVEDVDAATRAALADIETLESLDRGAEVGITAGSRGIHDMPTVLRAMVAELHERGFHPFVFPAMGSHGGATAEGQREMLEGYGITEDFLGCEIRASMVVDRVGEDSAGRPVFAAEDALAADAVLLANRVKAHTDFRGTIESGLCKMAVIGIGKQRGAEATHNAGLADGLDRVIPERAGVLFEETPVVGGVALVENAADRAAYIEGLDVEEILDREPELLERSKELLALLPVEDLDLLVIDEIGKNISGTGMDTNVIGRMLYLGQPEPETPSYSRIHVRGITQESHGNGVGIGLADFAHQRAIEQLELSDVYVNTVTGGEPARGRLPIIAPSDEIAFLLAYSTCGVRDPSDMRIARIPNTLELGEFLVSEPLAAELETREDVTIGPFEPLDIADGDLSPAPYD